MLFKTAGIVSRTKNVIYDHSQILFRAQDIVLPDIFTTWMLEVPHLIHQLHPVIHSLSTMFDLGHGCVVEMKLEGPPPKPEPVAPSEVS